MIARNLLLARGMRGRFWEQWRPQDRFRPASVSSSRRSSCCATSWHQETWGTPADLLALPPTHRYEGTSCPTVGLGASSAGGTVLCLKVALFDRASEVRRTAHARGRALIVSLRLGDWVHFTAVHVDPALSHLHKRRLLSKISTFLHQQSGNSYFLVGDWNFLASDECRMSGSGDDIRNNESLGRRFDECFESYVELMQRDFTYRRLGKTVDSPIVFAPRQNMLKHPPVCIRDCCRERLGAWVVAEGSAQRP